MPVCESGSKGRGGGRGEGGGCDVRVEQGVGKRERG